MPGPGLRYAGGITMQESGMEDPTRDGGVIEYSKAADPVRSGQTPRMPVHEFPPGALVDAPTGIHPLDLSAALRCEGPATSPGLLASFVIVRAGDTVSTHALATSHLFFVRRGAGTITVDGTTLTYGPGDLITLPSSGAAIHRAESDTEAYWVHDAPLLRYLGAVPSEAKFRPTLWKWETLRAAVHEALADPLAGQRSRISVLLTNTHFPQTMTITHVLWAMIGILPAGADQLPHRHQSVALDYIIHCPPGCHTKVAEHVDAGGNLIDPVIVPWVSGGAFTTPPGWWHSHHNTSGEDAYLMPIQDAGLHTYLRTLDIRFHRDTSV